MQVQTATARRRPWQNSFSYPDESRKPQLPAGIVRHPILGLVRKRDEGAVVCDDNIGERETKR